MFNFYRLKEGFKKFVAKTLGIGIANDAIYYMVWDASVGGYLHDLGMFKRAQDAISALRDYEFDGLYTLDLHDYYDEDSYRRASEIMIIKEGQELALSKGGE